MATTPRYIVRKVGDQFVPMRQEDLDPMTATLFTAGGVMTALWGLRHRGVMGFVALGGSACMIYRGMTGRNLVDRIACGGCARARNGTHADSPSYQHEGTGRSTQKPADSVDEASMESFPASDPPGRTAPAAV